eukprot:gene25362-11024_t
MMRDSIPLKVHQQRDLVLMQTRSDALRTMLMEVDDEFGELMSRSSDLWDFLTADIDMEDFLKSHGTRGPHRSRTSRGHNSAPMPPMLPNHRGAFGSASVAEHPEEYADMPTSARTVIPTCVTDYTQTLRPHAQSFTPAPLMASTPIPKLPLAEHQLQPPQHEPSNTRFSCLIQCSSAQSEFFPPTYEPVAGPPTYETAASSPSGPTGMCGDATALLEGFAGLSRPHPLSESVTNGESVNNGEFVNNILSSQEGSGSQVLASCVSSRSQSAIKGENPHTYNLYSLQDSSPTEFLASALCIRAASEPFPTPPVSFWVMPPLQTVVKQVWR